MQQPLPQTRHSLGLTCFIVIVFLAAVTTVTGTSAGSTLGATPARAGQAGSAASGPFFQDGLKIAPSDEAGAGQFGTSVALSADGTTALVGGPDDGNGPGAAWVFTRTSSGWSEQAKLTPTGEAGDGQFGSSVAVSADGNTALIGAPQDGVGNGAAWVFTRSGSTWAQQGEKLVPDDEPGAGQFGTSVALSADGATALIGGTADQDGTGAAWVFVPQQVIPVLQGQALGPARTGAFHVHTQTQWEEQAKLERGCCHTHLFGNSVALSSDGNVALVGDAALLGVGDVTSFSRNGALWNRSGEMILKETDDPAPTQFGFSLALAPDGNTAFIGGPGDGAASAGLTGNGAVWVYTFAAASAAWEEVAKVTPSDANEAYFGSSVGVSQDGSAVVIGGENASSGVGAAWVYAVTASGNLQQQGGTLTASDESGDAMLGTSAAISVGATTTVLVGGPFDGDNTGAVWSFSDAPPAVTGLQPPSGPTIGGTVVTISGNYLQQATGVDFGAIASPHFKVISADEVNAVSPPGATGNVDVTVTSLNGTSTTSSADTFTYVAAPTTTTTSARTTTTRPEPRSPVNQLSAAAIHASVLGHGKGRQLEVTLRVSEDAQLQLELLARTSKVFSKTVSVLKGANNLVVPLPAGTRKGTDLLQLTLKDTHRRHRTYTTTVKVPS